MTGTATIVSQPVNIKNLDNIGINIDWSGPSNGTISIECSVTGEPGSYKALTFSPPLAQPSGVSGGYLVSVNQAPFEWLRISYTNSSGVGALFADITAKDLN